MYNGRDSINRTNGDIRMIPQQFIDEVSTLVDLAQLIGERIPDLKRKNGTEFSALCPFHNEKTPSFTVSNSKQFYHCHGCGAHGGAINFIMDYEGKSFIDAVKEVADMVGMAVPEDRPTQERSTEEKQEQIKYMRACSILTSAQATYAKKLTESQDALSYLEKRGLASDTINKFGIGYAPDAWDTITGSRSFTREALLDSGLASQKEGSNRVYDRFRDRIMFPIYGKNDKVLGFGGRSINEQTPKYLNSPSCRVFHKGENLYGIKQAIDSIRQLKRVFVVEGYMDVVMLSQHEVENVIATLGTSVTEAQMRKLFKLSTNVTFCLDGDAAGRKAAWRAAENILPLLDEDRRVDFMFMPDGKDPDDFVRANGKDAFIQLALSSRTLTDYILDELLKQADMKNGESLASYLTKSNDMADKMNSGVIRLSFQKRIAELAGISLDTMLSMLKSQKESSTPAAPAIVDSQSTMPLPPTTQLTVEISVAAKMLAISALHTKTIATTLDTNYLNRFLSAPDKEMLFPLLAYLRANTTATSESITASLSFNSHGALIAALVSSSDLLHDQFDAIGEASEILNRFKKMEFVWSVVIENRK